MSTCELYTHTHTHMNILTHVYPSILAYTHARVLGVSQRAPLIRVPASRSHNLRPTSPPARHVGPVARRAAARVYYAHTYARARSPGVRGGKLLREFFSLSAAIAAPAHRLCTIFETYLKTVGPERSLPPTRSAGIKITTQTIIKII